MTATPLKPIVYDVKCKWCSEFLAWNVLGLIPWKHFPLQSRSFLPSIVSICFIFFHFYAGIIVTGASGAAAAAVAQFKIYGTEWWYWCKRYKIWCKCVWLTAWLLGIVYISSVSMLTLFFGIICAFDFILLLGCAEHVMEFICNIPVKESDARIRARFEARLRIPATRPRVHYFANINAC